MSKILVIHGPNLDLLGKREPEIYGKVNLDEINKLLEEIAKNKGCELEIFSSASEGDIVTKIGRAMGNIDAIVINPAAYTHTSVAIRDAIKATAIPTIEVHLSNIYAREEFRHESLIAPVSIGQISGFGIDSYVMGLKSAIRLIKK